MRSRLQRPEHSQFSILTPWEIDIDEAPINRYCSDLAQATQFERTVKIKKTNPNIVTKKRAISHCNNLKNQNQPPIVEKNKYNRTHNQFNSENVQYRALTTLTQNRTQRLEKRRQIAQRGVLQQLKQLSVKNFIIEGEQKCGNKERGKKRESSYILKQKFNEFGRSMKSITHFKENCNLKVVRYE